MSSKPALQAARHRIHQRLQNRVAVARQNWHMEDFDYASDQHEPLQELAYSWRCRSEQMRVERARRREF